MVIENRVDTRWVAGVVIAVSLGTGILTGATIASADTGITNTNSPESTAGAPIGPTTDGVSSRNLQEQVGIPKNAVKSTAPSTRVLDNVQKLLDITRGMNPVS